VQKPRRSYKDIGIEKLCSISIGGYGPQCNFLLTRTTSCERVLSSGKWMAQYGKLLPPTQCDQCKCNAIFMHAFMRVGLVCILTDSRDPE